MSNADPFVAGRVRRVRSTGARTVRSSIIVATRRRSSSVRSANDFARRTSTAEATILIEDSSPGSGSSPSAAERHEPAVRATSAWSPSGSSSNARCSVGRVSSIVSYDPDGASERYHASNPAS